MSRFDEISAQVQQCLNAWDRQFPSAILIPVPIEDIVDLVYGLRIVPADLGIELSGTYDGRQRMIEVNQSDPIESRRFTLAHELGHHLLHREILETVFKDYQLELTDNLYSHFVIASGPDVTSGERGNPEITSSRLSGIRNDITKKDTDLARLKREAEANLFAVELLIPLEPLIPLVQQELMLAQRAERFQVSPTVMKYRLHIYYLAEDPTKSEEFRSRNRESLFYQQFIFPREDPETN